MSLRHHILPVAAAVLALVAAVSVHAGPVKSNGAGLGSFNGNGNAGGSQPALAAPTYCSDGGSPNSAGMTLGDVTFSGNTPSTSADDCYGILPGNDSTADINGLGLIWGSGWTFLTKDDGDLEGGVFAGISFSLDAQNLGGQGGTWTLTAGPVDLLPVYVDFVAVLKGSSEFALWYFNDVRIGGNDGGDWTSVFTNANDKINGLSHMSLYVRQGAAPETPPLDPPVTPPDVPPPGTVPEPSGLALAALALVAAGAARRQRRRG